MNAETTIIAVGHAAHPSMCPREHRLRHRTLCEFVDVDELDQIDPIQPAVFPGGHLPSPTSMARAMTRRSRLIVEDL